MLTEGDLSAYEQDWRKRIRGKALAVVRPGNTQEVAAVVKACAHAGVSIVPQGGNTGLVVGGIPDESGTQILLSLQRMNAVRAIDAANLTMTVEAGCVLQAVQQAADGLPDARSRLNYIAAKTAAAAEKVLRYLARADFGVNPVADVRDD